ncbi:hypothetical protein ADUPG1_011408, partial [Aduncisulcus paluster]
SLKEVTSTAQTGLIKSIEVYGHVRVRQVVLNEKQSIGSESFMKRKGYSKQYRMSDISENSYSHNQSSYDEDTKTSTSRSFISPTQAPISSSSFLQQQDRKDHSSKYVPDSGIIEMQDKK